MRISWLVLVLVTIPGASAERIDAGAAEVGIDQSTMPDCALDLGPLAEFCPVSYDNGGTAAPGDDRVRVAKYVDDVEVTLRPPVSGPDAHLGLDLRDVRVQEPAYVLVNATWVRLNETLPPTARQYVWFESRPMRYYEENGTYHDLPQWGDFLSLNLPDPVPPFTTPFTGYQPVGVVCHGGLCAIWNPTYLNTTDDSIQPFPNGLAVVDDGTSDDTLELLAAEATYCYDVEPAPSCDVLRSARGTAASSIGLVESLTPSVEVGFQFNRTGLAWNGGNAAGGHAGGRDAERGASRGLAGAAALLVMPDAPHAEQGSGPSAAPPRSEAARSRAAEHASTLADELVGTGRGSPALLVVAAVLGSALLLGFLYHRITGGRVAEHPVRARALGYIGAHPGCSMAELAQHLGLSFKSTEHHARVLQRGGLIHVERDKHHVRLCLHAQRAQLPQASAMRQRTRRDIAILVRARPGLRQSDLAGILGVTRSTVHPHVRLMLQCGVLREDRRRLYPVEVPAARSGDADAAGSVA